MGLLLRELNCAPNCSRTPLICCLPQWSLSRGQRNRGSVEERGERSFGIDHNGDEFNSTELTGFLCSPLEMSNTHTSLSVPIQSPYSVSNATGFCINDPKMIFLHTISRTLGVRESAQSKLSDNGIQTLPFMA